MDQGRLMLPTMQRFERTVESKDAVTPRRDLEIETSANAAPLARTSASVTAAVVRLLLRIEFRFMRVRRTTSTLLTGRLCRDGTFRAQEPEDSTCTHDPDPLGHHCSAVANANDRGWSKGGLSGITAIDCNPKRPLYFFSRSSVASLRNNGRRRFAAFARSQGNDTSMRSASSSTSMLAAAVWPSARMRKRNVSPSQVSCSIAIIGPT